LETGLRGVLTRSVILKGAGGLLGLRKKFSNGDAKLGASFQNPDSRNLERKVFLVSPVNEPVEGWVVEHPPPVAVFSPPGFHPLVTCIQPGFRNLRRRTSEIRPYHAPWREKSKNKQSLPTGAPMPIAHLRTKIDPPWESHNDILARLLDEE
jgi:hypothetical protein